MTIAVPVPGREQLREIQLRKLRALLGHILPQNRFYARKLAEAGCGTDGIRRHEDIRRLPFTTKEELQEDQLAHPPYGTHQTYALDRYVRLHQTSGTSGRPVYCLDTQESWDWVVRCWDIIFEAAGIESGDTFFVPFGYGPFLGFWGAFEGAVRNGHLTIAGGGMTSSTRLRWIRDHRITVVACTPTYALRLVEVARADGIDLAGSSVRLVIVAGEPGGSVTEVRALLESGWGARCIDHWGMTEVGPLGFEPLERPGGVHLLETDCVAEVIDPETLQPVDGDGGRGELVITTLERPASPLIRYRTGDLVHCAIPEESSNGSGEQDLSHLRRGAPFLRLEGGILGRADQMVQIRGNNVYPAAIDAILGPLEEVVEYRAVVLEAPTGNHLRLEVETAPSAGVARGALPLEERIVREFKEKLFFRPEVRCVPAGSLPRFEFKARRFLRLRADEDATA